MPADLFNVSFVVGDFAEILETLYSHREYFFIRRLHSHADNGPEVRFCD